LVRIEKDTYYILFEAISTGRDIYHGSVVSLTNKKIYVYPMDNSAKDEVMGIIKQYVPYP
jgi:hypothetical protein